MGEDLRNFREVVLHALRRCSEGKQFLREALQGEFERAAFPRRLRGAASDLAAGVVRRRVTLDRLIGVFSDIALRKIDPPLLDVLRLAVYEVLFVERVPVHAGVSEAVELTKKLARREFAGFTNAVLRSLVRSVERTVRTPARRPPSSRELTVEPGCVVCFDRDVFCDPGTDLTGYLSTAHGMPRWLVDRWQRNFTADEVLQVLEASNARPCVSIRVNRLKTTTDALARLLAEGGVKTAPGEVPYSLRVVSGAELTALDAFARGEFYIQDVSAMLAPAVCAPRAGEKVLDLCAAPGGKTTHLAEIGGEGAEIFALDISPERLRLVEQNARRLGITNVRTCVGNARRLAGDMRGVFDVVLADVPCSNTGVLRRRVEARHRLRPETIGQLTNVQADILHAALSAARPDGRVVYSTCSIEPEENRQLVERVLAENPQWQRDTDEQRLPLSAGGDGGYVTRLIAR